MTRGWLSSTSGSRAPVYLGEPVEEGNREGNCFRLELHTMSQQMLSLDSCDMLQKLMSVSAALWFHMRNAPPPVPHGREGGGASLMSPAPCVLFLSSEMACGLQTRTRQE